MQGGPARALGLFDQDEIIVIHKRNQTFAGCDVFPTHGDFDVAIRGLGDARVEDDVHFRLSGELPQGVWKRDIVHLNQGQGSLGSASNDKGD